MSRIAVSFVLFVCVATAGCDESLQPIAGPSPNLTPTFSSIQRDIFESSDEAGRAACVTCHRPGGIGFFAVGLDLTSSASSYNALVGVSSRQRPGVLRVAPGDPDDSYLIHKLERRVGIVGLQMPLNGPPFLTTGQIRIINAGSRPEPQTTDTEDTVNIRQVILLFALVALIDVRDGLSQDQDDDRVIRPAQPDYTLVALPTAMRVPRHRSAFRVTHRFTRPLGQGDFGDLVEDAFGLDGGAIIGLEYRFGLFRGVQVGIHRTNLNKTIEFFTQYDLVRQRGDMPVGIAVWGSIDGTDNFSDSYSPALGAIISSLVGERAAFYIEPVWVNNSNPDPSELIDHNDTFMLGLSTRLRIRPTVYVVGEWAPRLAGHDPGVHHGSFAIEKRAGGHVFQLNFSNALGTTMGQIARGGFSNDDWYMGFNISRRFN